METELFKAIQAVFLLPAVNVVIGYAFFALFMCMVGISQLNAIGRR